MLTPLDTVVTIVSKGWTPAIAVFCDGLARMGTELCDRILIYRTEPLGDVETWAKSRDNRIEFRAIDDLGSPPEPWPARNSFERLIYHKLTLLGSAWLGDRVAWIDADILVRHPIDDLAELDDYTAPLAWGVKPPANHYGPAQSFGLTIFEPSETRLRAMLDFAKHTKPDACARDQNLVSRYMWAKEAHKVRELSLEFHINTRCKHYQPDLWERVGMKRLYHYGGPKPWEKESRKKIFRPWYGLFNDWITAYNDLDIGEPIEKYPVD